MTLKLLITGAEGLLGKNILEKAQKNYKIIKSTSKNCDLRDSRKTENFLFKTKPDIIIHAANIVYGITGSKENSYRLLNDNLLINTNILNAAKKVKPRKIIFISSSAVYSEKYKNNIKEEFLNNFLPHQSEFYYGLSKRLFYYQLVTLKKQYKIDFTYVILNNIYEKYDNFNIATGHVIPALLHKFYLAKKNKLNLSILGKKNDRRCFLYASDAARAILKLINKKVILINISSKDEITILNLVNLIKKFYKYNGKISWKKLDINSPSRRNLNLDKLEKIGFKQKVSITKGIKETIDWFIKNYDNKKLRK